jgi:hypothetical protein
MCDNSKFLGILYRCAKCAIASTTHVNSLFTKIYLVKVLNGRLGLLDLGQGF